MADGIVKGVGEQLGKLGKQIATDIAKIPAQIAGLDKSGGTTHETKGAGSGGSHSQSKQTKSASPSGIDLITQLRQQDEIQKQKELAAARNLIAQFNKPREEAPIPIQQKLEMEEMEKRKKEMEEVQKKSAQSLPKVSSKRPRGDLYGTKAKTFGGELGKNVKAG